MATGFSPGRIYLASFNSLTLKTSDASPGYLLYKTSYRRFCPKFRCHGNQGQSL